jgi:hypothetical protein
MGSLLAVLWPSPSETPRSAPCPHPTQSELPSVVVVPDVVPERRVDELIDRAVRLLRPFLPHTRAAAERDRRKAARVLVARPLYVLGNFMTSNPAGRVERAHALPSLHPAQRSTRSGLATSRAPLSPKREDPGC